MVYISKEGLLYWQSLYWPPPTGAQIKWICLTYKMINELIYNSFIVICIYTILITNILLQYNYELYLIAIIPVSLINLKKIIKHTHTNPGCSILQDKGLWELHLLFLLLPWIPLTCSFLFSPLFTCCSPAGHSIVIYYFGIVHVILILSWRTRYRIKFNLATDLDRTERHGLKFLSEIGKKYAHLFDSWICLCLWNILNSKSVSSSMTNFTHNIYFNFILNTFQRGILITSLSHVILTACMAVR